ncbi:MAG: histidine kinase [Paenibacillus sp.]|jgi:signal transduction histidine kinase|nr:histidine kinase [Paenibacillus sp.]
MKFRNSLLAKYFIIVFIALLIWPIVFPAIALVAYIRETLYMNEQLKTNIYASARELEQMWHEEAKALGGAGAEQIDRRLGELKEAYPRASMFWVDGGGTTRLQLPRQDNLPGRWNYADSIQFMKISYGGDPFTVVAFLGGQPGQGFMTLQVPRSIMAENVLNRMDERISAAVVLSLFAVFLFASWLFFYRIRKRLVYLQEAMTESDPTGIPRPIAIHKKDEIGQLELAFNRMVEQLFASRGREREEEHLRKQLIANLSHDLRTPLTTIRGHAYTLHKETLTEKGKQSLGIMEAKVDDMAQLIDNLLSYTLLSAGKYPLKTTGTDVLRLVRTSAASWFPVLEREGFDVDVDLPEQALLWQVDPQWFTRILDNLLQNAVRHAKTGKYIGIRTEPRHGTTALLIEDRGPGLEAASAESGAGIGLTIVSLMVKEMEMGWETVSSPQGTAVYLYMKNLNEI